MRPAITCRRIILELLAPCRDHRATRGWRDRGALRVPLLEMSAWIHDLRHAARTLARRPGLVLAVVLTLGPGLGGTVAVFDLVNLVAWRPPPVARPGEVVALYTGNPQGPTGAWGRTSYPDYLAYRDAGASFAGLVAETGLTVELSSDQGSESVGARTVSGNYFQVLGVPAAHGRTLRPDDDSRSAAPVAVLGFALWQRLFGSDPTAIGGLVSLDGEPFTVVGVASENFNGTRTGTWDLFVPAAMMPRLTAGRLDLLGDHKIAAFNVLGRLRPGVAVAAAQAEVQTRATRLDLEHPLPNLARRITVTPASRVDPAWRQELTPTLQLLGLAMVLLLLISCANVAHLLLARAVTRRREAAIRRALGAEGSRLLRQMLTETGLLALLGGLWGLCLAFWARSLLAYYIGDELARELRFDHRVLGLALLACLVATVLCGLVPALVQARTELVPALKSGSGRAGGRPPRFGAALSVVLVALSALLLASTGLVARSLWNLRSVDLGIEPGDETLVYATVWGLPKRFPDAGRALYREVAERAAALPGVRAAGRAQLQPPVSSDLSIRFRLPGEAEAARRSRFNVVDGGYFEALGIPLLAGRLFDRRDAADGAPTVVVNRLLADQLWPDGEAVGRTIAVEQLRPWDPGPELEVVGVVGSTRQHSPRPGSGRAAVANAAEPLLNFSYEQRYRPILALVLRTTGDPAPIMAALRREVRALDPRIERLDVRTFDQHVWDGLEEQRLLTQALGIFAALGWFLAVVGVAGVMAFSVSRQTRAIGIRMALGARAGDVLAQVLRRGLRLTLAGLAVGLLGSLAAAPLLRHLLFGVAAVDPAVQAAVALAILGSAAAALYLPARRAAAVDPLRALREE